MSRAQRFKEWQREWALIRREYLAENYYPVVAQVTSSFSDGYRWGAWNAVTLAALLRSKSRAESMGIGHLQIHMAQEELDTLEVIKVLRMLEELLTRHQRDKRDELTTRAQEDFEMAQDVVVYRAAKAEGEAELVVTVVRAGHRFARLADRDADNRQFNLGLSQIRKRR